MTFEKAIEHIIELNEEIRAVQILMSCIERNTEHLEKENAEMSTCLRMIKKINREKNEAISALCERD